MVSEQLGPLIWAAMYVVAAALVGSWTYLDAAARRSDRAWLWASGCALFFPFVPVYLLIRSRIGYRIHRMKPRERLLGTVTVAHFWAFATTVTVMDSPTTLVMIYLFFFPFGALLGYWLVWKDAWGSFQRRSR